MGQVDEVLGLGRLTGTRVGHHGYQFCPVDQTSDVSGTFLTSQVLPGFTHW